MNLHAINDETPANTGKYLNIPKLKNKYKNPNMAANVTKMQPKVIIG
jgi:hypothetical protein